MKLCMGCKPMWIALCVALMALVVSCKEQAHGLPSSTVRPYEVLVVNDSAHVVADSLSTDCPGLPQSEPMFDVKSVTEKDLEGYRLLSRTIVMLHPAGSGLRIHKNVHAHPQLVIHTDVAHLAKAKAYLQAFERLQAQRQLAQHPNPTMQQMVQKALGVQMLIPSEMQSYKKANNLIWLSNNTHEKIKNLCVMRLAPTTNTSQRHATDVNVNDVAAILTPINDLLRANIKGEEAQMYMQLIPSTIQEERHVTLPHSVGTAIDYCGLWQMNGDSMGGPFVMRLTRLKERQIVLLAFAYAPETTKRNIMQQLRAVVFNNKTTYGE